MNLQEKLDNLLAQIKGLASKEDLDAKEGEELKSLMEKADLVKVQIKALAPEGDEDPKTFTADEAKAIADEAVEKALKALPAAKDPASIVVVVDEADKPFLDMAEQCRAIKTFEVTRGTDSDARLKRLNTKQLGGNIEVPSEGGFMLEPELGGELLRPMHEEGAFTSGAGSWTRLPTTKNHGWFWGVDETSRATGSRWGGIQGYRLAEAETKPASQPKFRKIVWELKKYAVLVYGTDELLEDAAQFAEIVRIGAGEELKFMANDDILNGLGQSGPLGILASTAFVSVSAETDQVAATIIYENLTKMWARLDSRAKANANWYINTDCNPELDNLALAVGTGGIEARYIGYGADGVMRIKGRPVIETEFNATVGTQGDIMLADMSAYLGWMKEIQSASSIHVQFLTDQEVFRFVLRIDGQPSIAAPLTPYKGTGNTVSPFVVLDTRS